MRHLVAAVISSMFAATLASAEVLTFNGEVNAVEGKKCKAYLHVDPDAHDVALAISLQGTGIYTTGHVSRIDPALRRLARERKLAVLTLDKPGVHADATVDDAMYERYSQEDLVACSRDALRWARDKSPVSMSGALYFSGHS